MNKLLEHNKDWKIPERRVKKFLKRYLSKHTDPSGADDDASAVSLTSSVTPGKKLFKKIFGKRKSKAGRVSTATPPQESAPDIPPVIVPEPEAAKEEEPNVEEYEPLPIEQSRSLEQVYSDDNDGKKNDCHCNAEVCVIL